MIHGWIIFLLFSRIDTKYRAFSVWMKREPKRKKECKTQRKITNKNKFEVEK